MRKTEKEILRELEGAVMISTYREAGLKYGVSGTYIQDLLKGRRRLGPKILKAMGYRASIFFEREENHE